MKHEVRPKKFLGQHFLNAPDIAHKIAEAVPRIEGALCIEIGPGTGLLTRPLQTLHPRLLLIETDRESVAYLNKQADITAEIVKGDFLKSDLAALDNGSGIIVAGNFPYNISSQILFHCLEARKHVKALCGMFQKEVAERVVAPPGNKTYGIVSVLMQAYYHAEYLFTVAPHVFIPPPKVKSGVIRLTRKNDLVPDEMSNFFKDVVKTAFNQRRKTLSNALKPLLHGAKLDHPLAAKRAEQLSVEDFLSLSLYLKTIHTG